MEAKEAGEAVVFQPWEFHTRKMQAIARVTNFLVNIVRQLDQM